MIHIILVIVVIAVVIKLVVRSTGVGVQMHMETLEQSLLKLPIQETLLGNARTQPFSALGVELEAARRKRFWSVYIAKPGSKNVKEECRRRSISGVQTENQEIRRRAPASDPARKILPR